MCEREMSGCSSTCLPICCGTANECAWDVFIEREWKYGSVSEGVIMCLLWSYRLVDTCDGKSVYDSVVREVDFEHGRVYSVSEWKIERVCGWGAWIWCWKCKWVTWRIGKKWDMDFSERVREREILCILVMKTCLVWLRKTFHILSL